ncbi:MAG: putative n-acetylmuramoyl-l-alanine amidase [Cyanobacteria bacterium RYN_339]|nr:putative n-acetylmuramoyl-l-alanine amidase [Cyanobacteria bacterium RYN_339]
MMVGMSPTMRRLAANLLRLMLGLGVVASSGASKAAPPAKPRDVIIESIGWRDVGLVVQANAPLDPQIFTLEKPFRFVVDLPAVELADANMAHAIPVNAGHVTQVRMARKPDGSVRLVVDCDQPTKLQVMQLGGRATLVIGRAEETNAALANLFQKGGSYTGAGQEIKKLWARESNGKVTLELQAAKPLTYQLFEEDPAHMQVKIPAGRYVGFLPLPGKCLAGAKVRTTPEGTWLLDTSLADANYQLTQALSKDRTRLTLTWTHQDPHRFAGRPLVLIDAGHGGADPGALGPAGGLEKAACLGMAHALQHALWKHNLNAMLTRGADAELYLEPRLHMIDQVKADLFISLHANSHTAPDSNGTVTFYRETGSKPFAEAIQRAVTSLAHRPDRGVKQERLYVLRNPHVPSVLLETGFISNPTEERLLASSPFQAQVAEAIVAGVERYVAANQGTRLGLARPLSSSP